VAMLDEVRDTPALARDEFGLGSGRELSCAGAFLLDAFVVDLCAPSPDLVVGAGLWLAISTGDDVTAARHR